MTLPYFHRFLRKLNHQRSLFQSNPILIKESGQDGLALVKGLPMKNQMENFLKKLYPQKRIWANQVLDKELEMKNQMEKLLKELNPLRRIWAIQVLIKELSMKNLMDIGFWRNLTLFQRLLKKLNPQKRIRANLALVKWQQMKNWIEKSIPLNYQRKIWANPAVLVQWMKSESRRDIKKPSSQQQPFMKTNYS